MVKTILLVVSSPSSLSLSLEHYLTLFLASVFLEWSKCIRIICFYEFSGTSVFVINRFEKV